MTRAAAAARQAAADQAVDRTLQALAEPTRRAVVGLLRGGPQRAGDIAATLAMSRQAMSRHLRVLRQAGVILEVGAAHPDDDARARTYRLDAQPLAELQDWLGDVQAFWHAQMASFKGLAERVARERAAVPAIAGKPAIKAAVKRTTRRPTARRKP
jgi:DNA-binding transcriptional ArsR family regulator